MSVPTRYDLVVAKLSISIPDELIDDVRAVVRGNVRAFVATAVRHELGHRRLFGFLDELEDELGPLTRARSRASTRSSRTSRRPLPPQPRPGRPPDARSGRGHPGLPVAVSTARRARAAVARER